RQRERVRVTVAGDGASDVDEVHHRAAEDEAERVGVVRQDDLNGLGRRVLPAFGRRGHGRQCSPGPALARYGRLATPRVIRTSLRSRSRDTRYGLRNRCPTMPPTWKPRSTDGACRFTTTTEK